MNHFRALFCVVLLYVVPATTRASLDTGLTAFLPLGTDLVDHSPNKLAVKVRGKVALKDGSAFFPGNGNYLELPFLPMNDRDFSVSMWVCPTGDFPTYGLLQQWDRDEKNHILHLLIREGLHPWLGFYINDTASPIGLTNSGEWQHLVFQYTHGAQEIWINGRLICRQETKAYEGTSGATYIGRSPKWSNVPARDFEGYLSGVRLYARALKPSEVRELARMRPPEIVRNGATARSGGAPVGDAVPTPASEAPLLNISAGTMRVSGEPGEIYTVEVSSDLVNWAVLGTVTIGTDGAVDIVDTEKGEAVQRFYRLRYNKG